WGLSINPFGKKFLKRDNMLFKPEVYYFVFFLELVGRFTWTWSLAQLPVQHLHPTYLPLLYGSIEIVRRSVWAIIRLEHVHSNNIMKFRDIKRP
ncbi:phosphate transporter PHO1-9, partial [Planoprotostelium fungivorum]